ncbi:cysteine--tRNA ligase [Cryobacterium zongtaii]|uniref:Cysteine--tRNA ligase n=1 Tax=Cryobacterium zongtaii TaxID=1259217 RepID=A0A2S3ZMV2_9MICO|nr:MULTISPECIES: cysteine--tRNA ligase [Cryobacterium]ASD23000.1 cysteine--tRNA ligase [Cryobacterium sp. LW097]POH70259.1 cysteine--tRNA ligase [Cryobacterium zongtaii]TFC53992.1 cysteine--tRNA ligase [Cryobacterium sp. TMB3-1-2]TFC60063.1 cysteine--tRNA ligase [Cryobacterium sp. TMB1-7]TFC73720.1 cysteine--tRNA ligase [Cryobacterium sp. TMB3-15]
MSMRLYDSKAQTLRDFLPIVPGKVGIYVCGPTVQSSPHIGHLRSALVYDQLRRWLSYRGNDVTFIRNVTDIDDKILLNAAGTTEQWWALAYRFELEFTAGYQKLGILAPTYEPRATASVQEMQDIIGRLIDNGHAYPAADDSGDVYFDTRSWPAYGELTRQNPDNMEAATDADPRGKRDARDFALWKGHKADEPASAGWVSPWGTGRPGWHIECSAMAARYLGPQFDIHGGGLDLRFPHHENELAQSNAAGDGFANFWVHNGLVNTNGQKMSKSLGNSVYAAELLDQARAIVVRYYLGAAHYRSTLDFHEGSLAEAEAALERIESFLDRADRRLADTRFAGSGVEIVPDDFATAMDDDLAVPQALGVLHDTVRAGNAALDAEDLHAAAAARGQVLAMSEVLGINPLSPGWAVATDEPAMVALTALVERLLDDRETARQSRDYAAADRIRDELVAAGITIEDTPSGAHWSFD